VTGQENGGEKLEEIRFFFLLYVKEDDLFGNSFGILMLMLFATTLFYLLDFYSLIKRKSNTETLAIMVIPCVVSLMGATLGSIFIHVPPTDQLGEFSRALKSRNLNLALMLVGVLYLVLWAISLWSMKRRKKEEVYRWAVSCLPDYCFAAVILGCSGGRVLTGKSLLTEGREWLLSFYLYAVSLLCCKIILLAVALFVRLLSIKISVFKWKKGKNPSVFLAWYFCVCQNVITRHIFLFEVGILIPLTLALRSEGFTFEGAKMMGFLYLCGAFVILVSLGPMMKTMNRFRLWGNGIDLGGNRMGTGNSSAVSGKKLNYVKEQFCREYFVEEPICRNTYYTLTRHFLVEEQQWGVIYYLPLLSSVSGWVIDKSGKVRSLKFADGMCCKISEEEMEHLNPLFTHTENWLDNGSYAYERVVAFLPEERESIYGRILRVAVMIIVILFMAYSSMIR